MDTAKRLAQMLTSVQIQPYEVSSVTTYSWQNGRKPRASISLERDGKEIMNLLFDSSTSDEDPTAHAEVIRALLSGAEVRLADAEDRVARLREALAQRALEVADLQRRLAKFEVSRNVRGPFWAVAAHNGVWLVGRPAADAFGFHFSSWHDLATAHPGLRPCGVEVTDATYIIMKPIADLAPKGT